MKLEPSHDIRFTKVETFPEKVKRRTIKDNEDWEKFLKKLKSKPVNTPLVNAIRKTPDAYKNWSPTKQKSRNLEASISMMPFSMFKLSGLGNPKPINMMIEMADRSMQSPKGIVENVLVKIHNFIFPVDFVILNIIENDKVPIILGRPMLATAHAKIDLFEKKISLEVGIKQIVFNANEGTRSLTVSLVCIINDYQLIDDLGDLEGLEEVLMNEDINEDLGNFPKENGLLPNFDGQEAISFSPSYSLEINKDSFRTFRDFNNNMSIRIDDFEINDLWDDLDPGVLTTDNDRSKPEFFSIKNRVHQHNPYNLQKTYMSLLKKGLTEVLFGKRFKDQTGSEEDLKRGVIWFKVGNDKTIFSMPRAEKRFSKLTTKQHNMMPPILKISDKDMAKGVSKPYQKIKKFYKGFLDLGDEYKQDQEVIDWIRRGHVLTAKKLNLRSSQLIIM
ncbi:homeodomain-like protein [Tanacetum coccineum]